MRKLNAKKIPVAVFGNISLNAAIMIIFFLVGMVAGCIFNVYANDAGSNILFNNNLKEIATNGATTYSFTKTYINLVKYPAIIFLLGYTALGIFAIPLAVSIKGFFISFSVSSVIQAFGMSGFCAALAMFGLQTMVSIPCIIIMASFSLETSKLFTNVLHRSKKQVSSNFTNPSLHIILFIITAILLLIFALFDTLLTPTLVSLVAKNIF